MVLKQLTGIMSAVLFKEAKWLASSTPKEHDARGKGSRRELAMRAA